MNILIASPVHQKANILKHFIESLKSLRTGSHNVHYYFIDDNQDPVSSMYLEAFSQTHKVMLEKSHEVRSYFCTEISHSWSSDLIQKVGRFKDRIIQNAKRENYDYLFFIDSDLVLHPYTLLHLLNQQKDVISEIFWTKWRPDLPEMPQVWVKDQYTFYEQNPDEILNEYEKSKRALFFLDKLRHPGIFEVGGLGACTLISKEALNKGVSFANISNLSLEGEDRHFCVRAQALGFSLFVDTHYPAYHIYRESELVGVSTFVARSEASQQAMDVLTEGFESLGTFDFELGYPKPWSNYFDEPLRTNLLKASEEENERSVLRKTQVRSIVSHVKLCEINAAFDEVLLFFNIRNEGITNNETIDEQFNAEARVTRQGVEWVISDFFINPNPVHTEPQIVFQPSHIITPSRKAKITLSMVVKNESDRFLEEVLSEHRHYIDEALIIDDGSTDSTADKCELLLKGIPTRIIRNQKSLFHNEHLLRKQQWEETIKNNPEWILNLDADEIFEKRFRYDIKHIVDQYRFDVVAFRLYDFWNDDQYREDKYWNAHAIYRPFLVRYNPHLDYQWRETAQHSGRFPQNITMLETVTSPIRLKHYGWKRDVDRIQKYERYMKLDPNGIYGIKEQYDSILDPNPVLVNWVE